MAQSESIKQKQIKNRTKLEEQWSAHSQSQWLHWSPRPSNLKPSHRRQLKPKHRLSSLLQSWLKMRKAYSKCWLRCKTQLMDCKQESMNMKARALNMQQRRTLLKWKACSLPKMIWQRHRGSLLSEIRSQTCEMTSIHWQQVLLWAKTSTASKLLLRRFTLQRSG